MVAQPIFIKGRDVIAVNEYKYLSVHLNNSVDWRADSKLVYKKGMSRLYFLAKVGDKIERTMNNFKHTLNAILAKQWSFVQKTTAVLL